MIDRLSRLLAEAAVRHSCTCSKVCDGYWKRGKVAGCKNLPISADTNPPTRSRRKEDSYHFHFRHRGDSENGLLSFGFHRSLALLRE